VKINGIAIDTGKLVSKEELLKHLQENGANDRTLTGIRDKYDESFGNELMWRYPISDSENAGVMIVVVKEGFLSLPYNEMDTKEYEIYDLDKVYLLDEDDLERYIDDWEMFSDDLLSALRDMRLIVLETG